MDRILAKPHRFSAVVVVTAYCLSCVGLTLLYRPEPLSLLVTGAAGILVGAMIVSGGSRSTCPRHRGAHRFRDLQPGSHGMGLRVATSSSPVIILLRRSLTTGMIIGFDTFVGLSPG
jgi:tetrahydromethanopterin S-methyltransferase subunit E